jgi:hypothetical protein
LANTHVKWSSFEQWVGKVRINAQSLAEIPVNREVKYDVPKPAVPLEKLELLPEFRAH